MFDFKVGEKAVPLNWGTWSMKRFCEIKGITIVEYFDIIGSGNIQLVDVIAILQAAAEHGKKELKSSPILKCVSGLTPTAEL